MEYSREGVGALPGELQAAVGVPVEAGAELDKPLHPVHAFGDHDAKVFFICEPRGNLDGVVYMGLE